MPLTSERYLAVVDAIDAANAEDPNRVVTGGAGEPLALAQGRAATRWVRRLAIHPSEPLLLAARAHHLRRWEVPRSVYPDGRAGYLSWRNERMQAQARDASNIMTRAGYDDRVIDRVRSIIRKQRLRSDQEVQTYEDAASLVFLETQLDDTAERLGTRAVDVLAKILHKMTPIGISVIPELSSVPAGLIDEALHSSVRTDLDRVMPLPWSDPVDQTRNLIRRALVTSRAPVITMSGQLGGVVLLHLIRETAPTIPVVFADTGYHFPETLEFIDELRTAWDLNLRVVSLRDSVAEHEAVHGSLYETDPDACCGLRKVAPVERALSGYDTWFTAVRRDQSMFRSTLQLVAGAVLEGDHAVAKVSPILGWSWDTVERYADRHRLPRHPLYAKGYTSIGCAPCTIPTFTPADDRSGRWEGAKVECGLHIQSPEPR